jgi:hypothetical protein
VAGPCAGQALERVALKVIGGCVMLAADVAVSVPEDAPP